MPVAIKIEVGMAKRPEQIINASQLAYIAAKPDIYVEKKGKAWNPDGAKLGQNYHDAFGARRWTNGLLIGGGLITLVLVLLLLL